jgi:PAS domain S-box-containing protein
MLSINKLITHGYMVATLSTSAILLSIWFLKPALEGVSSPLLLFLLAVMLASWHGEVKAGFWATILSVLFSAYFLEDPLYSFHITKAGERIHVLLLAATGGITSLLIGALRRSETRALEYALERKRQLREEAEFANGLIQSLPGLFYLFDSEGRFLRWNRNLEIFSGYTAEEIERAHPLDFIAEDQRCLIGEKIREVFETGSASVESWLLSKAGQRIPFHFTGVKTHLRGKDCLVGVGFDLTERRRIEETLQQTNRLLEGVVNNTHLKMACLDTHFNFIWVNQAYARAGGHKPEFFPGRNHFALYAYGDNEAIFRRVVETGSPCFYQARPFEFKDRPELGVTYWDWGLIPIMGSTRKVERLVLTLLDVTARVRTEQALRENEERLRLAQECARVGIWDHDLAAGKVTWSPELEALYGLAPETFTGAYRDWRDRVHPEDIEAIEAQVHQSIENGAPFDLEYRIRHASGSIRWLVAKGGAFYDAAGVPVRVLGVNMDITERKRMERALHEADRRKDEFLAMLGHELRNPLAPIRNVLEVLKRPSITSSHVEWARDIIDRQTTHLTRLVDDLLDISRVTQGKIRLHKEPVDLAAVIALAVETIRPVMLERRHVLTVTLPPSPLYLNGDHVRLAQILANLLSNASKYSEEAGQIELILEQVGREAVLRVRDRGIGIPKNALPHIFELFIQLDRGLDRSQGGLGIGLSLVKRLVDMHGGRVEAFSEGPGQGSEFVVHFPLLARENESNSPPKQDTLQNILGADDSFAA